MPTQMELLKKLKHKMIESFGGHGKRTWTSVEVVTKLKDVWTEFLEHRLERK